MPLIDSCYFNLKRFVWRKFPRLMGYLHRKKSAAKFVMSGCLTGGLDLLLLFVLHGILGFGILRATSISFVLCFVLSFLLHKIWTFRDRSRDIVVRQILMFLAIGFVNLNFNGILMHVFATRLHIWYLFSQLLVNFILAGSNYTFSKFIIFRKRS